MKPFPDSGGYWTVGLSRGKTLQRTVHGLVALAFLGPRPEGMECRHLDGDQSNNTLSNLVYGTRIENRRDIVRHGHDFWANKTHCPQGHEYTEANTRVRNGSRHSLTCNKQRTARSRRAGLSLVVSA